MPHQTEGEHERAIIYFIGDARNKAVKIGSSTISALPRRFSKLQVGNVVPLRLLAVRPGGKSDELTLHKRHTTLRIRGEWFRWTTDVEVDIEQALDVFGEPPKMNVRRNWNREAQYLGWYEKEVQQHVLGRKKWGAHV